MTLTRRAPGARSPTRTAHPACLSAKLVARRLIIRSIIVFPCQRSSAKARLPTRVSPVRFDRRPRTAASHHPLASSRRLCGSCERRFPFATQSTSATRSTLRSFRRFHRAVVRACVVFFLDAPINSSPLINVLRLRKPFLLYLRGPDLPADATRQRWVYYLSATTAWSTKECRSGWGWGRNLANVGIACREERASDAR
jgi:hypothetical protein